MKIERFCSFCRGKGIVRDTTLRSSSVVSVSLVVLPHLAQLESYSLFYFSGDCVLDSSSGLFIDIPATSTLVGRFFQCCRLRLIVFSWEYFFKGFELKNPGFLRKSQNSVLIASVVTKAPSKFSIVCRTVKV